MHRASLHKTLLRIRTYIMFIDLKFKHCLKKLPKWLPIKVLQIFLNDNIASDSSLFK
jgi:branched-subunit amino acid transport protein AzlD